MKLFSPGPTQSNPTHGNFKNTTQTQPSPIQPMGEPNPRPCLGWRSGNGVRHINEVTLCRAR